MISHPICTFMVGYSGMLDTVCQKGVGYSPIKAPVDIRHDGDVSYILQYPCRTTRVMQETGVLAASRE